jgi:hypothetical protein
MNRSRSRNPSAPYLDSTTIEVFTKLATDMRGRSANSINSMKPGRSGSRFRIATRVEVSITDQRGRPLSSYARISSAPLPSITGKLAQCSAISSNSSARRRFVRSIRTRSSRARRAFVTASVLLSPVARANSAASFSVSGFRMLSATDVRPTASCIAGGSSLCPAGLH